MVADLEVSFLSPFLRKLFYFARAHGDYALKSIGALFYTDGDNSVTVKGVTSVTLKFGGVGEDAAMFATLSEAGAFKEFTSQKIFEENKGLLA